LCDSYVTDDTKERVRARLDEAKAEADPKCTE